MWAAALTQVVAANWYVNPDATGLNNGTSWSNAWRNFASIVWGSAGVRAGDTLYISGGAAGRIYTETLTVGASGTASSRIFIRPGQDAGHNGPVTWDFDALGDSGSGSAIAMNGRNYITIDGGMNGARHFVIRNLRNILNEFAGVAIAADNARGLVVSNVHIYNVNNALKAWSATEYDIGGNVFQGRGDAVVSLVASSGSSAVNRFHHNVVEILFNTATPPGGSGPYAGPDGLQCGGNISIYANTFKVTRTSVYTSSQHPDSIQTVGDDVRIYNNEFVNIGDSAIDRGLYADQTPSDIWIYNNVFRIVDAVDTFPEYIRLYAGSGGGSLVSLNHFKVLNNLFVDNVHNYYPIRLNSFNNSAATGSGNEIKNNIFCNMGTATYPVFFIENAPNLQFEFDRNVYFNSGAAPHINYRGRAYTLGEWKSAFEPGAITAAPQFVSYSPRAATNDFHLRPTDTAARDAGVNLSAYFSTDKDGVVRPQGAGWDIGPYEFAVGGPVNLPPNVSTGTNATLYLPTNSFVLAGGASDPEGASLALNWMQVSGPATATLVSRSSAVTRVIFPTNLGVYTFRLTASDGTNSASAETQVTLAAPQAAPVAMFEAESGTVTAPFGVSAGAVSQAVETDLISGGRAVYAFNVPSQGQYTVTAWVNAPTTSANSFYINVNAEPTDPYMIWDVLPLTSGFEARTVSWRGNGTFDNNEFNPKVFTLTAGAHSLVVIGREANAALDRFEIRPVVALPARPVAPSGIRVGP
ncbi:MAG: hypothetical protein N3I86_00710 [Verrucomicrobiae bacterium]|nr:hypothetical protein [Verrucomicrobiae bacterium]